jgi:hypothetical protein
MTAPLYRNPLVRGVALLAAAATVIAFAGVVFSAMYEPEPIVAGPGVTRQALLSDYEPRLKGTPADTPVFILEGAKPGGTMMLLGGTHAQEISGLLAAVMVIENVTVERGRLIVVPQANRSGFTHTEPLEGFPHTFTIKTPTGERWFRNGMRLTNPLVQWPDPDLYLHSGSSERMVGWESRNLNRSFPGNADGRHTERVAAALIKVAETEQAGLLLDMHEAYPEYPIINMLVAHESAFEVGTLAVLGLQMRVIRIDLMPSPPLLRGLSPREFGDRMEIKSVLSETANPAMGRLRGRTDEALLLNGVDDNYVRAAALGRLFVPFTAAGHPLTNRVGRQLATIEELLNAYNELEPDSAVMISNLPAYEDVEVKGIGPYLLPVPNP